MKTATSPLRSAIILGLSSALTVAFGFTAISVQAQESRTLATASQIPLSPEAPETYVVKQGDTLWDIAKVFLRDAWYWPEIWHINPQVQNPHLIYPGDTLTLTYVDGQPRVALTERASGGEGVSKLSPKVRSEPLDQSVTSIPYDVVASFMGRPSILDADTVKTAPYIVAMRDGHMIGGAGNEVYVSGLKDPNPESRYNIVHVGEPLRDPDNNDLIGYTGLYVGTGPIVSAGEPSKLLVTESTREALQGDKVFSQDVDVPLDFTPRPPEKEVDGAVVTVQNLTVVGQYQVIAINRGARDGLEPGHVLEVYQEGKTVRDTYSQGGLDAGRKSFWGRGKKVKLPDERSGVAMIFKAYDRMSYGLVMEATTEIRAGDRARNPQ